MFTREAAQAQATETVKKVVEEVSADEFINSTLQHASVVKQFADNCRAALSTLHVAVYAQQVLIILDLLWPAIEAANKHTVGSHRRQAMYSVFHRIRTSQVFVAAVDNLFRTVSGLPQVPHFFVQIFSRMFFEHLMLTHERVKGIVHAKGLENLTAKEENAVRYTAGYIVSRLPSKISKIRNCSDVHEAIKNMTQGHDKDTRLNYTKEWVSTQTRGGLTLVNDLTFLFFCQLEKLVRLHLPQTSDELRIKDIRQVISTIALLDNKLNDYWDQLTRGCVIDENSSLRFFQLVIDFYTQVRGFSFARVILETHKMKTNAAKKSSKGLRASLKRAQDGGKK